MQEIHDDEEEEEEEEEVHPGTILDRSLPNPFLGLSPQSITNAALALANVANTTLTGSKSSSVELDIEERKQRQQLLMGGEDEGRAFYKFIIFLFAFMCFQMTLQNIGNSAESTTHSIIIICLNYIIFSGAGDLIDPELFASGFGK